MNVSRVFLLALLAFTSAVEGAEQGFRSRASAEVTTSTDALAQDVAAEVEFGKDVAARILGRHRPLDDAALTRYVNLIGAAVAANSDRPELTFHFAILDTDAVNAYAAPGGYVFITRGALMSMQDEAELAAVLAHEVAHVSCRHIVRELKIRGEEKAPEAGLARLLGAAGDPARVAFAQAVDKAVALLFESGLSQEDELEADRVGTLIAATTGYDPTGLRRYVAQLKAGAGESTKVLQTTHPAFDKRLAMLDELIAAEHLSSPSAPRAKQRFDGLVH